MCPEPGLISAYVDDEVPSPWKERLAAHLCACPDCAAKAKRYTDLGLVLSGGDDLDVSAAVARLEARLGPRLGQSLGEREPSPEASNPREGRDPSEVPLGVDLSPRPKRVWQRSIPIPMPVAAAAAAVVVFLAGLIFAGVLNPGKTPVQSLAAAESAPSQTKFATMDALVKYLESQDAQVNLTIQLPSGATFDSSGRPVVVKAADANYAPFSATSPEGSGP